MEFCQHTSKLAILQEQEGEIVRKKGKMSRVFFHTQNLGLATCKRVYVFVT